MWNFDVTENGVVRVRSRRFLAHLNRTGEKPNFGLLKFSMTCVSADHRITSIYQAFLIVVILGVPY